MLFYLKYFVVLLLFIPEFIYSQKDLETCTSDYELRQFIYATSPHEDAFVAVQRLAATFIDKEDWDGAVSVLNKYMDRFPDMQVRFLNIIDLL